MHGSDKYLVRYAFSGKIICGHCGGTFKRRIHSGGSEIAWVCGTHIADIHRCPIKYVRDALIDNTTADKAYERIKKQFQKYKLFDSCKNDNGEYQFHDIIEPLAFSEIYRRKDITPSDSTNFIIRHVYCKLIRFTIDGKIDSISALEKYRSFFEDAYKELVKTVYISDAKFSTYLDILIGTAGRISLRLIAPKEKVDMILM